MFISAPAYIRFRMDRLLARLEFDMRLATKDIGEKTNTNVTIAGQPSCFMAIIGSTRPALDAGIAMAAAATSVRTPAAAPSIAGS